MRTLYFCPVVSIFLLFFLAFLHWVRITFHPWPFVSDIAIFVLKRDVKLQLTNSSPNLSGRRLDICHFYTWCSLNVNLECRSEMCCIWLAGNTGHKMMQKIAIADHRTTLSGCVFATKAYVNNLKKLVKQQYLLYMSSQYGELRPTNGWDLVGNLGHPSKFQRVLRLGSVTARHSSSGLQPNFVVLNRGRHLYLVGRSLRCALAHILVFSGHVLTQQHTFLWHLID